MNQPYEISNHVAPKPWHQRDVLVKFADGVVRCMPPGFQQSKSTGKERVMDEAKKLKIEQLAANAHDKSERYRMLGMMNTPSESAAKKQSAIEYAVARGEMIETNIALEDALNA